jgi:hypothetical protein
MKPTAFLLLALAAASACASASTTDVLQNENGNAMNNCRGALPVHEASLRSRPLALVNESGAPAYVNCAFRAPTNSAGQEAFGAVLHNYGEATVSVNCVGVIGVDDGQATYIARTVSIGPGQRKLLNFDYQTDNESKRFQTNTGLQCLLPANVGINETPQTFRQK